MVETAVGQATATLGIDTLITEILVPLCLVVCSPQDAIARQNVEKYFADKINDSVQNWLVYVADNSNLARSANLPIGLCILPSVISSFFTKSKAISISTGPIFTIFTPNGRYLREFS